MSLSSRLAASRYIQPGVCTSTTRPASPYEGQVIYETDTNQTLVYSGSAWVMVHDLDTPPALQLVKTQTLSGTATQVESCFTSDFHSYRIMFTSLTFSTESLMTLRLVSGATPNQTSNYYASGFQVTTGGSVTGIGGIQSYWHTAISASPTAGGAFIDIYNPQLSVGTTYNAMGVDTRTDGAPLRVSGGFFNGTTSFDGIWISTLNGTYTLGGTVRIYGYRNSI